MPCHPALVRIDAAIAECLRKGWRTAIDQYLDLRIDFTERATEWDAERWGFDPDRWMADERAEMDRRASRSST